MFFQNLYNKLLFGCFLALSINIALAAKLDEQQVTIVSPKYIIGGSQKYHALIKNVIVNRFDEIFESPFQDAANDRVIVEFFDYTCGHCKNMHQIIKRLQQQNEELKVVYKEFPIRGNTARTAAKAAIASKQQNKYNELHQMMLEGKISNRKVIFQMAKKNNLNIEQLKKDMESEMVVTKISSTYGLAKALKVTGTPTFIVLGRDINNQPHVYYVAGILTEQEFQQFLN